MEEIKGYVEHIVYRNEDNGYTVFHLNNSDGEVTCVGNFHFIEEGELLRLTGGYTTHKMYGLQFAVEESEVCEPEDLISIERYLGSGAIKGIGAALAGKIVKKFKENTFRIIEEEPERLAEIKGISERKAREIASQVEEKKDMRQAMIYLQKFGISTTLAAKIYQHYGRNVYRTIEENPYQLADHVPGLDLRLLMRLRQRLESTQIRIFVYEVGFYTLQQSVNDGHIYLYQEALLRETSELLGVQIQDMEQYLMDLAMEKRSL